MEKERVIQLLKEFDEINGVSGNEDAVAEHLKKYLEPITDHNFKDVLGNAVFVKEGKNPDKKIMLTAHMDEIGFMVSDFTDDGPVYGVTGGGKPIHQSMGKESAGFTFEDIRIDVGAETAEEARALGIKEGDLVNIEKESHVLNGKYFSGKAVDNRSSCVSMILLMEALKDVELEASIYACGTVQEELGLKGASALVRRIDPDIALCIDVGLATEHGELNPAAGRSFAGKGPMIELFDWTPSSCSGIMVPRKMVKELTRIAEEEKIPYQRSAVLSCGTDACAMVYNNTGVMTGGISIPEKYIHTTIGVVNIEDVIQTAKLGAAFIEKQKFA